jgi:hypothetical protein
MVGGVMSKLYESQILSQIQQFRTSFQQLGSDIQSGNVSSAQQDFANLTKASPLSGIPASDSMQQLGNDLQSGNLSSAQQDYATIQRALQQHRFAHVEPEKSSTPMDAPTSTDPLGLLKSLVQTAASAYGLAGLTGSFAGPPVLSQQV